ncbi:metallophosphoesterase (plasmid) [Pseudarthrobacter chlorophenolicus A6]|uniref:Metallophosphoesterase n=2 Tax=Pseudarthrobacter chlorophenolicus TaxID=85085 RepID=B8HI99_PSECP|nr:metallophosphoesterase [Pseudarthrobacter chlorophenolicus A6]SDQ14036.1 Calcineurin-like phosphoesterase [Pseudarthrobacter chlorophenolicus]
MGMETLTQLDMVHEVPKVLIAGDWHGNTGWMHQVLACAARDGYKVIIHVGDLKVLWPDEYYPDFADYGGFTAELVADLERLGLVFIFADGNHDAHPALRALPLNADGFGAISDRLLYAPRGHRWTLGGVRFGALGGAYSIDRGWGTEGRDWFLEETVVPEDVAALGTEPLDVLISHDVPAGIDLDEGTMDVPEAIERESYIVRSLLREAVRNTEPRLVFSGHWHQRRTGLMPGMETRVHVLDKEFKAGNLVTLDLSTLAVEEYKPV